MSAPNTNVPKQARRHRAPLIGIALAVVFGAVMAFLITSESVDEENSNPPDARTPAATVSE